MHGIGSVEPDHHRCLSGDPRDPTAAAADDAATGGADGKPDDAARPTSLATGYDAPRGFAGSGDAGGDDATAAGRSLWAGPRKAGQKVTPGVAPAEGCR